MYFPSVTTIVSACAREQSLSWTPKYLSKEEAMVVDELAELILPRTNTPGARDAGVPAYIDRYVMEVFSEKEQNRFKAGLKLFDEGARESYDNDFSKLSINKKRDYFLERQNILMTELKNKKNGSNEKPFILVIRELTMLGFLSSKIGTTQVLKYDAVPGSYKGCISVADVGYRRGWSG